MRQRELPKAVTGKDLRRARRGGPAVRVLGRRRYSLVWEFLMNGRGIGTSVGGSSQARKPREGSLFLI